MASGNCCTKLGAIVGLLKAIMCRFLFIVHGLICIWRLFVVKQEPLYWCLILTLLLLIVEMIVTIRLKNGVESGWFSPSVFLYLSYTLPPIWLLELDLLATRIEHRDKKSFLRATQAQNVGFFPEKIGISISLDPEKWVRILQQVLLLLLIIGRWLLPKGKISREQLSQLLLIYIGMAADIIELFEAFKETAVMYSRDLTIVILSLWTASLLQFTFVVGTGKARQPNAIHFTETGENKLRKERFCVQPKALKRRNPEKQEDIHSSVCCCCCTADTVSILTSVTLQDGPFLVLRMLLIFHFNVLSYTNIFFTSKNTLVILLQVYRLIVLYCEKINKKKQKRKTNEKRRKFKRERNFDKKGTKINDNHDTEFSQTEQISNQNIKNDGCCFCCKCNDCHEKVTEYEESEDEEEIVISNAELSENLSKSDLFEIVTGSSLKDGQINEACLSVAPLTEKVCVGHKNLERQNSQTSEEEEASLEKRQSYDCQSQKENEVRKIQVKTMKLNKEETERLSSSSLLQENCIELGLNETKQKKPKIKKDEPNEKKDFSQFNKNSFQTNENKKDSKLKRKSSKKDSSKAKLFDVAIEAQRKNKQSKINETNEASTSDFKEIFALMTTTKCPNCSNSKNRQHFSNKQNQTPQGFIVYRIEK